MSKKIVSAFEFAIAEIADPERAKALRPETREEQLDRRVQKLKDTAKRIRIKKS